MRTLIHGAGRPERRTSRAMETPTTVADGHDHEPDADLEQVGADVFGIGKRQHEAIESAEREPAGDAPHEVLPTHDAVIGQPADERYKRQQVGNCVDPHDEYQPQHQPADEEIPGRVIGRMGCLNWWRRWQFACVDCGLCGCPPR